MKTYIFFFSWFLRIQWFIFNLFFFYETFYILATWEHGVVNQGGHGNNVVHIVIHCEHSLLQTLFTALLQHNKKLFPVCLVKSFVTYLVFLYTTKSRLYFSLAIKKQSSSYALTFSVSISEPEGAVVTTPSQIYYSSSEFLWFPPIWNTKILKNWSNFEFWILASPLENSWWEPCILSSPRKSMQYFLCIYQSGWAEFNIMI